MRRVILALFVLAFASPALPQLPPGAGSVLGGLGLGPPQVVHDPKALAQAIVLYNQLKRAHKIAKEEAAFVRGIRATGAKDLWEIGLASVTGNCPYAAPWGAALNRGRMVSTAYNQVLSRLSSLDCNLNTWATTEHRLAAQRNRVLQDVAISAIKDAGESRQNGATHEDNYKELVHQLGGIEDPLVSQKDLLRMIAYATTVQALTQRDINRNTLASTELLAVQASDQLEMNRSLLNTELRRRALVRALRSSPAR